MDKKTRAELILAGVTVVWGGTFPVIKTALFNVPPLLFLTIRFTAALILFIFIFRRQLKVPVKDTLLRGLLLGLLMFIGYSLQTIGLKFTTVGKSSLITYSFALYVPLLQFVFCKKPLKTGNLIGLVVVFCGIYIITSPENSVFNTGDVLTFIAAFGYAFYIVFLDIFPQKDDPAVLTTLQFVVAVLMGITLSLIFEKPYLKVTPGFFISIGYLSLFGTVLAIYLMNKFQKDTTPTKAVIIYSLEPVFSILFGAIFIGEPLSLKLLTGGALVLSGVLLSELWFIIGKIFSSIRPGRPY
ncbi:MAG: DMT family transporter [Spirochaetota bacterium]